MSQAIEDKLTQEHQKRMDQNDEAIETRNALVQDVTAKDEDADDSDDDDFGLTPEEEDIMRKMAEKK